MREVENGEARRLQRVICGDLTGEGFNRYEAIGDVTADVLGNLDLKISVERFFAATEQRTLMSTGEWFQAKWARCHSAPNNSRRRSKARMRAGLGSGGLRMASAIRR